MYMAMYLTRDPSVCVKTMNRRRSSQETTAHFNEVARSMLSMGAVAPRKATGAL